MTAVAPAPLTAAAGARKVLLVTLVGVAASALPTTLLSAVLPTIARDLRTTTSAITWVQTAPSIAFAIGLPLMGKIGDLAGHRRVFIGGFAAMALTALATAASPNVGVLIATRTANQLAGAATNTAAFGLIAHTFADSHERTRAFALYTSTMALSPVVAVIAGGPLVEAVGWPLLFVGQAAFAAIAVAVAWPILPDTPRRAAFRFDFAGALALAAAVTAFLFAVNRMRPWGFDHPVVLASLAAVPVLAVAFAGIERRQLEPLMPLRYFGVPLFSATAVSNFLSQCAYMGGFTIAPFIFSRLFGYSTGKTALLIIVRPVFFSLFSWVASRHHARWPLHRIQTAGNAALAAAGIVTAIGVSRHSLWILIAGLALAGVGVGYTRPGIVTAITAAVDARDVGVANGVNNMASTAGSAIGITALLAIVGDHAERGPFVLASVAAGAIAATAAAVSLLMRTQE